MHYILKIFINSGCFIYCCWLDKTDWQSTHQNYISLPCSTNNAFYMNSEHWVSPMSFGDSCKRPVVNAGI